MKIYLCFILILFCSCGFAQNKYDTSFIKFDAKNYSIGYGGLSAAGKSYCAVYVSFPDSNISIEGDTISVIKMLIKRVDDLQKIEQEYYSFISASVKFSNSVPDMYRSKANNCGWVEYYAYLKNKGYGLKK